MTMVTTLSTPIFILILAACCLLSACVSVAITLLIAIKLWRIPLNRLKREPVSDDFLSHYWNSALAERLRQRTGQLDVAVSAPQDPCVASALLSTSNSQTILAGVTQETVPSTSRRKVHTLNVPTAASIETTVSPPSAKSLHDYEVPLSHHPVTPDDCDGPHSQWTADDENQLGMVVNISYGVAPSGTQRRALLSKTMYMHYTEDGAAVSDEDEEAIERPPASPQPPCYKNVSNKLDTISISSIRTAYKYDIPCDIAASAQASNTPALPSTSDSGTTPDLHCSSSHAIPLPSKSSRASERPSSTDSYLLPNDQVPVVGKAERNVQSSSVYPIPAPRKSLPVRRVTPIDNTTILASDKSHSSPADQARYQPLDVSGIRNAQVCNYFEVRSCETGIFNLLTTKPHTVVVSVVDKDKCRCSK